MSSMQASPRRNRSLLAGVAIGVTERFPNIVSSGFDSIRVRGETCRILKIQKIDYKRMQADLAAEKKARG